ncbi:TrbI/VirB10 family protein [Caulobacter sp. 602-1]|uniref:TrbI/VirB10 family protein n=1 Tax=Caulobacter sp. 602-1 TaxID=2492472 RepID=UPI000F63BF90|nr:TrbI/VirB10 family protein [Caulobacter sp. 602-1]RRN63477.1 TrbI/VirB10 family protein [Caulobacter sp. 602-1]
MSGTPVDEEEKAIARTLRLRASPPPITRLSRRALMVSGAVLGLGVAGALGWSLIERHKPPPEPAYAPAAPPPEPVVNAPRGYGGAAGAPVLGPPLPGDLGRPILANQGRPAPEPIVASPPSPALARRVDPAPGAERTVRQAAASSGLFAASGPRAGPAGAAAATMAAETPTGPDPRMVSAERLQAPASPYLLQAGAIIPAALVTGLRSDIKGPAIAQVTQNVFDSLGGGVLLIPAGSRLVGEYDSGLAAGQSRLGVVWTRLILPSGRSIVLDKLPAADVRGMTGLQDGVDRHGREVLMAAALSTLLAVGAEAGASDESDLARAVRRGTSEAAGDVGRQMVGSSLARAPTLTIRPGAPLRVLLTRDLVLEPYVEGRRP